MKRTSKAVGGSTDRASGADRAAGPDKSGAVCGFISFVTSLQVAVKIAHWTTESYARHVALDELHSSLQTLGDQFVEAHMGRHGRPRGRCIGEIETKAGAMNEDDVPEALRGAMAYLQKMAGLEPELASVRDDMLAAVSKALYLLQLK